MPEAPKLPTQTQISDGRRLQEAGSYGDARVQVSSILEYPLSDFIRNDFLAKQRFLSAAGIFVRSSIGLARGQKTGALVAQELQQARHYGLSSPVYEQWYPWRLFRFKAAYFPVY